MVLLIEKFTHLSNKQCKNGQHLKVKAACKPRILLHLMNMCVEFYHVFRSLPHKKKFHCFSEKISIML